MADAPTIRDQIAKERAALQMLQDRIDDTVSKLADLRAEKQERLARVTDMQGYLTFLAAQP